MFRGINAINLDSKGRCAMPSRYRDALTTQCKGHVVLTIDTEERCLLLYPLPIWEGIETKIAALPSFNVQARRIQRLLMGHATELELDGQGRLVLPPLLRDYAHIDKKLILLGQGNKFELWDESEWQHRRDHWLNEHDTNIDLPGGLQDLSL